MTLWTILSINLRYLKLKFMLPRWQWFPCIVFHLAMGMDNRLTEYMYSTDGAMTEYPSGLPISKSCALVTEELV